MFAVLFYSGIIVESKQKGISMLVDRYGRNIEIGEFFIRLDQNNEGRLYQVDGYPADGRIAVHEHSQKRENWNGPITEISPVRLKQTIVKPREVLWYPRELLPELRA